MNETTPNIPFVIGEEKHLSQIISRSELEPLLLSSLSAGISRAALLDADGLPFCDIGAPSPPHLSERTVRRLPIRVEGEPQGILLLESDAPKPQLEAVAQVMQNALQLIVTNNLKRMLTTEVHTSVVQESYDQLVLTNRQLRESERRYRDLTRDLEQKVEERTAELWQAHRQILQQEKLAVVGQLAAGMAHEINNPIGFIRSNLVSFSKYLNRLAEMLRLYRRLLQEETSTAAVRSLAEKSWSKLKLDFVLEDSAALLGQSLDGADRIAGIVAELKSFTSLEGTENVAIDLNLELEQVLASRAAHVPAGARLSTDLKPLPPFVCHGPLMVQAFANIIDNALKSRENGLELSLHSRQEGDRIVITVSDNGSGIAEADLPRIFDPFFTTRPVGTGTGMGLAVARAAIHGAGGSIEIDSAAGQGTTCTIKLPTGGGHGYRHHAGTDRTVVQTVSAD